MRTLIAAVPILLLLAPTSMAQDNNSGPDRLVGKAQVGGSSRHVRVLREIEQEVAELRELLEGRVFSVTRLEVSNPEFSAAVIDAILADRGLHANHGRAFCRVSGFHAFVGYQWDGRAQNQTSTGGLSAQDYGNLVAVICANPRMHHDAP